MSAQCGSAQVYRPRDPRATPLYQLFESFYERLAKRGFVVYPGKVSDADCFRIGTIGRIGTDEMRALLVAIETTLGEMGIQRLA